MPRTFAANYRLRLPARALLAVLTTVAAPLIQAATITVDTHPVSGIGMVVIANDGLCSLREAIINANTNTATHSDCAAGSGSYNTLVLPTGAVFTLTDAAVADELGQTGLPYIVEDIRIEGNGATIASGNTCTRDLTQTPGEFRLLLIQQGVLSADDLTLANGCADGASDARYGGAIHIAGGALFLRRSTLRDNHANRGAAVYSRGNAATIIEASTMLDNSATFGGALYVDGLNDIFNSTLSGNQAATLGGSVYVQPGGVVNLEHTTLDGSGSLHGWVIFSNQATIRVKNTLLASAGCDENSDVAPSTWIAFGDNLDSGTSCANRFGANVTANVAINLEPLADNGGPTLTHALLPGSPGVDAALSCTRLDGAIVADPTVFIDQRGEERPQGAACDIGAYELDLPPSTIRVDAIDGVGVVPILADGLCSLREALENANGAGVNHADCEPGGGADIVLLPPGAVFTLNDAPLLSTVGRTALPPIRTTLTLAGGLGTVIQRNPALPCVHDNVDAAGKFRLLYVRPQGRLTVQDLTLANACASGNTDTHAQSANGGAILSRGELTLRRSTLSGNSAGLSGGGIGQEGVALIETSTLTGNWSELGGAVMSSGGSTTVRNSTLSNNAAGTGGGAIIALNTTLHLEQSTLVDNTSSLGGGVMGGFFATLRFKNSVLQNSACADGVLFFGFSTEWSATGSSFDSGNTCTLVNVIPNTNAHLGMLAENGGTTRTHALLPASPARNAANDCTGIDGSAIGADQRGIARPQAGVCDIGSFEAHTQPLSGASIGVDTVDGAGVVPVLGDGLCSLREAIENANASSASFAHGDCAPGSTSGLDEIILPSGAVFSLTDAAITAPFGNTALPAINTQLAIRGNGATIQSGDDCVFNGTQSPGEFRFFLVQSGTLELERLTLANGCADGVGASAARDGGAIYVQDGALIADQVTLRNNRARRGGAIYSAGHVRMEEGTLSANSATFGGAIYASGSTTLSNMTVAGNVSFSLGGAAFIESGATLDIEQSTLDTNTSGQFVGIYSSTSTVNLKNTILRNTRCDQNSDLGPSIWNAFGNNLDDGITCASRFGASVTPNTDPLLGTLAANGGFTRTHALLPGSPAIDGASSCTKLNGSDVLHDQRGIARPQGGLCDIGAFESRGFVLTASEGSGQATAVGTAFDAPLVVTVDSAFGEPVNGGQVRFAAPDTGASLATPTAVVTITDGQASLDVAANGATGEYVVTASSVGSSAAVGFSLSNLAAEIIFADGFEMDRSR